jgi:hypothetical protein
MKFKYNENMMSSLIRLAPWADLDEIREALIKDISVLKKYYSDSDNKRFEQYIAGERSTIPTLMSHRLPFVLSDLYGLTYHQDHMREDALSYINNYFFYGPNNWICIDENKNENEDDDNGLWDEDEVIDENIYEDGNVF